MAVLLARAFAISGYKLFLVDADPSPSLGSALGIAEEELDKLTPISEMSGLIQERTGVAPGTSYGVMFQLNPKVDDIPARFSVAGPEGIRLLVVGSIKAAGTGCFCPENALVRRLLKHLIVAREEILIMDMEAGIEHLGRGTVKAMDILIIVLEPGMRSVKVAEQIRRLGEELGIKRYGAILNKAQAPRKDEKVIKKKLAKLRIPILGTVPFNTNLVQADLDGIPLAEMESAETVTEHIDKIRSKIEAIVK